jgi:hypothetical protein
MTLFNHIRQMNKQAREDLRAIAIGIVMSITVLLILRGLLL